MMLHWAHSSAPCPNDTTTTPQPTPHATPRARSTHRGGEAGAGKARPELRKALKHALAQQPTTHTTPLFPLPLSCLRGARGGSAALCVAAAAAGCARSPLHLCVLKAPARGHPLGTCERSGPQLPCARVRTPVCGECLAPATRLARPRVAPQPPVGARVPRGSLAHPRVCTERKPPFSSATNPCTPARLLRLAGVSVGTPSFEVYTAAAPYYRRAHAMPVMFPK